MKGHTSIVKILQYPPIEIFNIKAQIFPKEFIPNLFTQFTKIEHIHSYKTTDKLKKRNYFLTRISKSKY